MTKTVTIDGKSVPLRATAALPRLYRATYGRDFFQELYRTGAFAEKRDEPDGKNRKNRENRKARQNPREPSGDDAESPHEPVSEKNLAFLEILENLTHLMARSADPQHVPADIVEWLDSIEDPTAIFDVAGDVIELYIANLKTTSVPKKKHG